LTFIDASEDDVSVLEQLLGRKPAGRFAVVVRRKSGEPVVIENEPHLRDGTPMPTLYWLVDKELHEAVSRIEGDAGVHRYEALIDPDLLRQSHEAYAERRNAATVRRDLVQPSGGVGGTRIGVKCLHAHLANYLVGNPDPVGEIVASEVVLPEIVIIDVRN
jgi:uncharacterized protein